MLITSFTDLFACKTFTDLLIMFCQHLLERKIVVNYKTVILIALNNQQNEDLSTTNKLLRLRLQEQNYHYRNEIIGIVI